jgi:SanA protein
MNKKGLITIGTFLVLILSTPFLGTGIVALQTADQIYKSVEEIPQKEVGLVLGAAAYENSLSTILQDRVDTAIDIYNKEKISVLVMSGSAKEATAMQEYAENAGIPPENIIQDATGLNTMASVQNIAELSRSVIIVSQQFHLPRALFIANSLGIDAIGMRADRSAYTKIFDFKKRELLATSKAVLDIYKGLLHF